ncbi:MAG: thiamine pyrophosphate-dependent enzyme [Fimbriimonadales bacterium]|nr:thiamine pyrophosphate-dependent enzyme [Fimbriimonadales bacterium]
MGHPNFDQLALLRTMLISREADRREGILLRQGKGWFQIGSMGHEAIAALALAFREDDWFFPYYRDRALMLARGYSLWDMALDFFAKAECSSGGTQMPCHFSSRRLKIFSVATPTASSLLPACGAAWGMRLDGKDTVCQASLGDAASRQGEFFEALAFAVQERLPVVFCVMDNGYGISTPTQRLVPSKLGLLAPEFCRRVDGRDPAAVLAAGSEAVRKARSGEGPSLLWFELDRLASHTSSDDHRLYRDPQEIEAMLARDPLRNYERSLLQRGLLSESELRDLQADVAEEVASTYQRAEREADPCPDCAPRMFGPLPVAEIPPFRAEGRATMVSAINRALDEALARDPKVLLFGEDIEDPKGGVFGITKGLSTKYPGRVRNSPLAEATIVGVGVGLAAYGYRPVFELQFIDFLSPGWNQLTTNLSTLRWRTRGEWTCPVTLYAPSGAYLPGGGPWHSQSFESHLAGIPGIHVAMPSNVADAAGLAWTAIHAEDPVVLLIPKHVFRKPEVDPPMAPVSLGSARRLREGSGCTIVTWGNCTEIALEAASRLEQEIDVEILDLRSIAPWDRGEVVRSVARTGRLVVVHEDPRTCGFGDTVVSSIVSDPAAWDLLAGPPIVVARKDVPIGFHPNLEYGCLPTVEQVVEAVRKTLR